MKRPTKVTLVKKDLSTRDFNILSAQNLLQYEAMKGFDNWKLPENSPFTYSNGIIERSSNKTSQSTQKRRSTTKGSKTGE